MSYISMLQGSSPSKNTGHIEKTKSSPSFEQKKHTLSAEAEVPTEGSKTVMTGDDFGEYKASIYSRILDFSQNASRDSGIFVELSDECLYAMRNDKAYENWVLHTIQQAYAPASVSGCITYTFLKFGKTQEEFTQSTFSFPDRKALERLQKLQQEQREALKKQRQKRLKKKLLEEKWQKQACQAAYVQLKILDHKLQVQDENKAIRYGESFHRADHDSSLLASARRKAKAYESTFLYSGISNH